MDKIEDELRRLAPVGHYLALRVGFAFPLDQIIALPDAWVDLYRRDRLMLVDPVLCWCYRNTGVIRWSEIDLDDPHHVLNRARSLGLCYGAAASVNDDSGNGQHSFGWFARDDREFSDDELAALLSLLRRLDESRRPPTGLTRAELEALGMVRDGLRLKQIAHDLGVSEGAVKQRLRNARIKLGAATSTQAAAMASSFALI
ncbi:MAG: autoinducer binding domain-containing protein [Rubellimicrobium sp.]|nr:autoinducer binding domain-containing protein [Rubellimicrobium sp.]